MNINQIIKKELSQSLKYLPQFEPYKVLVKFDSDSLVNDAFMYVAYHENQSTPTDGYLIAFELDTSTWHVLEYVDGGYQHVVSGGNTFESAYNSM